MKIPDRLGWWSRVAGGEAWLASLPAIVDECVDRWDLRLGSPFEPARIALAVPVTLSDGEPAVLKVNFPAAESVTEARALAHWQGRGAVRLLAADEERCALLVERCLPGAPLALVEDLDAADRIAASVLRRLWRPAPEEHPFRLLEVAATAWRQELLGNWERLGRPIERELVDRAHAALGELAPTQPSQVVCHSDFHGHNVLAASREPWLAIDPKPFVGEPAFDAASWLVRVRRWRRRRLGSARHMRRSLDLAAAELALDRERIRAWAVAHAVVWALTGSRFEPEMATSARLLERAA